MAQCEGVTHTKEFTMFLKSIFASLVATFSLSQANASTSESLLGVNTSSEGIEFQVYSGGCTKKQDFELLQLESFPVQLDLRRLNKDFCEAYLPYGTKILYTWDELGVSQGTRFILRNDIAPIVVR